MKRTLPLKTAPTSPRRQKDGERDYFPRRRVERSTYRQWLWHPPYRGSDAASAPGVGEGRRKDRTALSTSPRTPSAPAEAFLSVTSPGQGDSEEIWHEIQGKLFLLSFLGAAWAKPFSPRLGCQPHTGEVEPLDGTIWVVTANHLSIGDLVTKAICGFVGIHRHIQHIRGMDTAKGH